MEEFVSATCRAWLFSEIKFYKWKFFNGCWVIHVSIPSPLLWYWSLNPTFALSYILRTLYFFILRQILAKSLSIQAGLKLTILLPQPLSNYFWVSFGTLYFFLRIFPFHLNYHTDGHKVLYNISLLSLQCVWNRICHCSHFQHWLFVSTCFFSWCVCLQGPEQHDVLEEPAFDFTGFHCCFVSMISPLTFNSSVLLLDFNSFFLF